MGTVMICVVLRSTFLGSNTEPGHCENYPLRNAYPVVGTLGTVSLVLSPTLSPTLSTLIMCVRTRGPEGLSNLTSHAAIVRAYVSVELS